MANELITAAEVISATGIRPIDQGRITPHIEEYQRIYLFKALGEDFYNELVTQNNGSSLTAANTTLLNSYIKNYLAYSIVYEIIPLVHYEFGEGGVKVKEGDPERERGATQSEVGIIQNKYKRLADGWLANMHEFLRDNITDYPEFEGDYKNDFKHGIIFD